MGECYFRRFLPHDNNTRTPIPEEDQIVHIAFYAVLAYFLLCGWCVDKNKPLPKKEVMVALTVITLWDL
ncbi:MAG: hypothetical protein ACREYE_10885 [Gammaproteobacteria bacterium]